MAGSSMHLLLLCCLLSVAGALALPSQQSGEIQSQGDAATSGDNNIELAKKDKKKKEKKEDKEEKEEKEEKKEEKKEDTQEQQKDEQKDEQPKAASSGSSCVPMNNFMNAQYTVKVGIGNPPQDFPLVPDTGSGDLVVSSVNCITCPPNKGMFNGKLSSTYSNSSQKQQLAYGQGVIAASRSWDDITIGDTKVKKVAFLELEMQMLRGFEHSSYDGIIGLSKLSKTSNNETSFTEAAKVDRFGMCLSKVDEEPGIFTVNGIHPEVKEEDVKYVPVIGEHHWAVNMNNVVAVKEGAESSICKDGCAAIVDSGTTLVGVPGIWMKAIEQQTGVINEDCSNLHELPDIKFSLEGLEVNLTPKMYVMNITADHQDIIVRYAEERFGGRSVAFNNIKEKLKAKAYPNVCMSTFMDLDLNSQYGPVFILGMPFFRQYYTIFDRKKQKIGFSEATFPCNTCEKGSTATGATNMAATEAKGPLSMDVGAFRFPEWAWPADPTAKPNKLVL